MPAADSSCASRQATSRPYRDASREPTIATAGRLRRSIRPSAYSRNGGSAISLRASGYSASNAVTRRMPVRSTAAAQRNASVSCGARRTTRASSREPRSEDSSSSPEARRASRLPRARRAGHRRCGVSSRPRAHERAAHRETESTLTPLTFPS